MSADLKVVGFQREGWRDPVKTLESIIEMLKSGEMAPCEIGALVTMNTEGAVEVFGFGPKAEDLQVLALLRIGETSLIDSLRYGE